MSTASSDMSALTASLERSLQNFSLNPYHHHHMTAADSYGSSSTSTDDSSPGRIENRRRGRRVHPCLSSSPSSSASSSASKLSDANTLVELNSHMSMPYHWEQCLDLKTGEVYYINWRTGMKVKDDPRLSATSAAPADHHYYSEDNDDDEQEQEEEDDSVEDAESEGSSTEYLSPTSRPTSNKSCSPGHVLVVAGCKICMMYYMVPKHVDHCPKCTAHLLHFDDRSVPI